MPRGVGAHPRHARHADGHLGSRNRHHAPRCRATYRSAAIVGEVVELYEDIAEDKRIEVSTDIEAGLTVPADPKRLRQVLANLVDNAIKYTPAGGRVVGERAPRGRVVRLDVTDTGIGIAPHDLPHIWDRLYRGDQSRAERGLGLGLSLVRAIVAAHGGTVDVVAEPGRGSRSPFGCRPAASRPPLHACNGRCHDLESLRFVLLHVSGSRRGDVSRQVGTDELHKGVTSHVHFFSAARRWHAPESARSLVALVAIAGYTSGWRSRRAPRSRPRSLRPGRLTRRDSRGRRRHVVRADRGRGRAGRRHRARREEGVRHADAVSRR